MLSQLSSIKSRLAIDEFDVKYDVILTAALNAVSVRFDHECNRSFARTVNATHEFEANELEILPPCYPIECLSKFEIKQTEAEKQPRGEHR